MERNDLIESEEACYLLVKRGLYYRPDRQGYTGIKEKAGRYTRADGEQLSRSGVSFVHVDEAEEYSPSCNAETKADHLQAVLADRDATIATLSEALAEAEKKGAEDWRGMASAPRDASEIIVRMPKKGWPGYYRQIAHWAEGGGDDQPPFRGWFRFMADGYVELPVEPTGWMPLAPPRDLAQGGQHG